MQLEYEQLTPDAYVMDSPVGELLVNFSSADMDNLREHTVERTVSVASRNAQLVEWGKGNNLPGERELLIADNNIVPRLIQKRRNMVLGAGRMLYKERFEWVETPTGNECRRIVDELEVPTKVLEEIERLDIDNLLRIAAGELVKHNNVFVEYLEKGGGQVVSAKLYEATYVRAEKRAKGEKGIPMVKGWLLSGDWCDVRKAGIEAVPNWNPEDKKQTKYIRRFADELFGGPYYYSPSWWGSRLWIKLANNIPIFHLSNLNNGYSIRYHIKVPKDYFLRLPEGKSINGLTKTEKEDVYKSAEERKKAFMQKLNETLVGLKNAGRTIFTTYDVQAAVGGQFPGVLIEAVPADLKDESLLKLFDKANSAQTSSQGVLPSISGVETGGKLSSGSDIRNAYSFYLATDVQEDRRIVYEILNYIAKKNAWFTGELAGAKFGARDTVIVTTDKNPTGIQEQTPNQQP